MNLIKSSDFIAWDALFLDVIGPDAKLERIQSFEGEAPTVHEAPAYVPETNELFFSDTKVTGWLWAIEVDTLQVCICTTDPGQFGHDADSTLFEEPQGQNDAAFA